MGEFRDTGIADIRQNQMIAGIETIEEQRCYGGHAARQGDGRFTAIESSKACE